MTQTIDAHAHRHNNMSPEIWHHILTVLLTIPVCCGTTKKSAFGFYFHCNFIYLHCTPFLMCGLSPKWFRNEPMWRYKLLELRSKI